jgi:selenium metabolism protein YedF
MPYTVDARGLSCPEPVILAKKAIEQHEEVEVIVDNKTALENIKRLAVDQGCIFEEKEENGTYHIYLKRREKREGGAKEQRPLGPTLVVISSDAMGRGDDQLGKLLIRAFIHTLTELEDKPDVIVLYNSGVLLSKEGSDCVEDLSALEKNGVKILICGTCVNHFGIKGEISVGTISNMYVIAETLLSAGRIVYP